VEKSFRDFHFSEHETCQKLVTECKFLSLKIGPFRFDSLNLIPFLPPTSFFLLSPLPFKALPRISSLNHKILSTLKRMQERESRNKLSVKILFVGGPAKKVEKKETEPL
jgi:hypothetical protein